jgi:hypothetical protein
MRWKRCKPLCGDGLEYLNCSLARLRGNKNGTQSQMTKYDMVTSPAGLGPENDSAGKAQENL